MCTTSVIVCDSVLCYLDTTFISEGNETYIDGLVNFEKMVTIVTEELCNHIATLIDFHAHV